VTICVAALALAGAAGCARGQAKYPEAHSHEGAVAVEVGGIEAGAARFFTFRAPSGKTADFFVYRESGGQAHAALDACRTCFRWKKGYRLEGGKMVCIYCGMRFGLDTLAEGIGSCVPIALQTVRDGSRLVIPVGELEEGLRYF
jgi:uncharacterized membrane protein